jgi:Flp pilus assembly protein TadG
MGLLKRFRRDQKGLAAIEFAFVAPVLVAMYFGVSELCAGMLAERRASHAAAAIGDLVAQTSTISASGVTDVFSVANIIMAPFPTASMHMRVTSIVANGSGALSVGWSQVQGMGAMSGSVTTASVPVTVPANGSVIRSDVQYTYTSLFSHFVPTPIVFNETFYFTPRQTTVIPTPT